MAPITSAGTPASGGSGGLGTGIVSKMLHMHTASGRGMKRPWQSSSSSTSGAAAQRRRRSDYLLLTIGALVVAQACLSLTAFAPLQMLSAIARHGSSTQSYQSWPRPRVVHSPEIHAQDNDGDGGSASDIIMSDAYQSHVKRLGARDRRHKVYAMSQFDPNSCCNSYHSTYYKDVGHDCVTMEQWQTELHPTCNLVHEYDLADGTNGISADSTNKGQREQQLDSVSMLFANGDYRDVWIIAEPHDNTARVMKTLQYGYSIRPDHHRMFRDEANAMDHLSASPYVANSFGLCGVSSLMNFASTGNFKKLTRKNKFTRVEKIKVATQVARMVADIHGDGGSGKKTGAAVMAVADLSCGQFIFNDETRTYQIHDMNLIRMMKVHSATGRSCQFQSAPSAGSVRSPEEYWEKDHTEKVDIWALGNVIHYIICGDYAFNTHDVSENQIRRYVKKGKIPPSFPEIEEKGDDVEIALLGIIKRIRRVDPADRPSASEIRDYLEEKLLDFTGSSDATVDAVSIAKRPSISDSS